MDAQTLASIDWEVMGVVFFVCVLLLIGAVGFMKGVLR